MRGPSRSVLMAVFVLGVAGCNSEGEQPRKAVARPVLSVVVAPASDRQVGFAGTIQPRYKTERGFRVLGRLTARTVDVGDVVKAGQKLAQIDPLTYELAVRSATADLAKANSQLANTTAAQGRAKTLLEKSVKSQAEFDATEQARASAAAAAQQAQAALAKAREQLSYTVLTADIDGVVISTDAEVGQMAPPGKKVMTLARTDVREAVVDLPEDVAASLKVGSPFVVGLQVDPSITMPAKVREIAPEAEATTRTRRVRITLDRAVDPFRLGVTITAKPVEPTGRPVIDVPRAAILERGGAARVWLVDPAAKTVRTVPVEVKVEVAARDERTVRIVSGLDAGSRIVVAGVHSLSEGQRVKLDARTAK